MERTLAILKPDCVGSKKIGKVLERIEAAGFRILGIKMVRITPHSAAKFYEVHRERSFYKDLCAFMSSGPAVPMALEKENAVADFRKLIGATDPAQAKPGTIRCEFATSTQNNIVHGSDSPETAASEISFFFSEHELVEMA